jgi:hypothetical protein
LYWYCTIYYRLFSLGKKGKAEFDMAEQGKLAKSYLSIGSALQLQSINVTDQVIEEGG